MRAQIIDDISELRELRIAGSIQFVERADGSVGGLHFVCPCGCGNESYLPLRGTGHSHEWDWDGNWDAPTLTPSIFNTGMPCRWHGWLRAGEWQSC
ncbi:hypothetical protein PARHAE_02032 [Paracoccus haematequi]|uniref:Uncharacterized protein n=1 Tax=Paracoccus haematequi TaxID=2491866 RepID=A0A447IMW3_9RHOB|nr:DUF6527 family protein [Paracoccus haematequi]VDS08847.1 hypothetical protein PARHAE_02032 [Paracoccus haematequi]